MFAAFLMHCLDFIPGVASSPHFRSCLCFILISHILVENTDPGLRSIDNSYRRCCGTGLVALLLRASVLDIRGLLAAARFEYGLYLGRLQ
ncbi:hypothetical protein B0H14DRAFT_851665 [Mycena olivaceomarginata]|nr:hypothetical protein B0H14DRAFT_851665 [Mycena olivaceomarginata]